jgi:hypothetical protein
MTTLTLEGRLGRPVAIDLCEPCQAFWFDGYESLQLSPASVLELFRVIGGQTSGARPFPPTAGCPRCRLRLRPTSDLQRTTRFEYHACPQRHGRLISFFNFLREKDFIRPLTAAQIAELRRHMKTVNCSNCGAPVDLAAGAACGHCASPLSMIDVGQAETLVASLRERTTPAASGVDPTLPLSLGRARRDVEAAFASFEREPGWFDRVSSAGLVGAGLGAFARWLRG